MLPRMRAVSPTVGTSIPRIDGAAKVTGEARYVDDLPRMPGEIFGATVRSNVARGNVRAIHLRDDFDWSDVTVVRAADIVHNFVALIVPDQPIVAGDLVRHCYEPIALVACDD